MQKTQTKQETTRFEVREVGTVKSLKKFIVNADNIPSAINGQVVEFERGMRGLVRGFSEERVQILVLGSTKGLRSGGEIYNRGEAFHLPDAVARTLTFRYALFFFVMAAANEAIWRTQSTLVWGLFKFPGVVIAIFVFAMAQAPLMMKHMPPDEPGPPKG